MNTPAMRTRSLNMMALALEMIALRRSLHGRGAANQHASCRPSFGGPGSRLTSSPVASMASLKSSQRAADSSMQIVVILFQGSRT